MTTDWTDLAALQAAGLSQADVQALAVSQGGVPATSADSAGLPTVPGSGSPLIPQLPPNPTLQQQEQAAMAEYQANPQLQQYIQQTFGYIGSYMLNVPELLPILVAAGLENWQPGQFDAAVAQTQWWKNSSQAQRNFQELQTTNPGEADQQVSQMQSTILTEAQSLGVTVPPDQLHNLALFAVQYGWTADVIQQTLRAGGGAGQASTSFGATATFADQAQQLAGEYAQPLSDAELQAYVQQNLAGTLTADGLQQEFAKKAEQQMPWMASSIQMGVTPSQYLSGYASAAGQTLDIGPSDVNWSDPKWFNALLTTNPQGQQTPLSISQFQQNLMKNPVYGYQNTKGARDQAYATAQTILQTFGKVKS